MSESPQISVRFTDKVHRKLYSASRACGMPRAQYVREVVERALGVESAMPANGFAGFTDRQRSEFGRRGGLAKAEKSK